MHPEKNLLIVEDNAENARLLADSSAIPDQTVEIRIVNSVRDAIEAVKKHQPDFTFLDLNLEAGGDGSELIRMTEGENRPFIKNPIAVISAYSNPDIIDACFGGPAKVVAFLVKPQETTLENISDLSRKYLTSISDSH